MDMNITLLVLAVLACLQSVNGSKSYEERNNGGRLMSFGKLGLVLLGLNCATFTGNSEIQMCPGQLTEVIQAYDFPCDPRSGGIKYLNANFCECLKICENSKDCVSFSHGDKSQNCEVHKSTSNSMDDGVFDSRAEKYDPDGKTRCYHVLRWCSSSLPPNAQAMMNYIRCSDGIEQSEFFDKYLTSNKKPQPCRKLQILYEIAKKVEKCISKSSARIVENAKARIVGKNVSHEAHVEMFEDYLATLEDLERKEALELVEIVKKINDFDFFKLKNLELLDQPQSAVNIKMILENYVRIDDFASKFKKKYDL